MKHSEELLRLPTEACFRIQEIDPAQGDAECQDGAMNVSRSTLEMRIREVVADKDAPVVCYCSGGNRDALAADTLQRMGYTNVVSIAGGLMAYLYTNKS